MNKSKIIITFAACVGFAAAAVYTKTHLQSLHASGNTNQDTAHKSHSDQVNTPYNAAPQSASHKASSNPTKLQDNTQSSYMSAGIIEAQLASYPAHIVGYGEVHANREIQYRAQISGRVIQTYNNFEVGNQVKQGTILAQVDAIPYRQALAQAKANLAQAKLALLEEQRRVKQAQLEWEGSGLAGSPDSPLVLRQPQLAIAVATVKEKSLAVDKAMQDLRYTKIRAPFDALIVQRQIQTDSSIQSNDTIATLYSLDRAEITLSLSEYQWQNLPALTNREINSLLPNHWPVDLQSNNGQHHWRGYLLRIAKHLDPQTRQRQLVVAIDHPLMQNPPLYPGTFVKTSFEGKVIQNIWKLPATVLSQRGEIWYLDSHNILHKTSVIKRFQQGDDVFLEPISGIKNIRILKRPLNHYVAGMKIIPIVEG